MKKIIVPAILFLISVNSYAIHNSGYISRIYPSSEQVRFRLVDDPCNNLQANEYYQFTLDSEGKKVWASMLIAAATANRKISVSVNSCDPGNKTINYIFQDFN